MITTFRSLHPKVTSHLILFDLSAIFDTLYSFILKTLSFVSVGLYLASMTFYLSDFLPVSDYHCFFLPVDISILNI